jgi:hypothetical protein
MTDVEIETGTEAVSAGGPVRQVIGTPDRLVAMGR